MKIVISEGIGVFQGYVVVYDAAPTMKTDVERLFGGAKRIHWRKVPEIVRNKDFDGEVVIRTMGRFVIEPGEGVESNVMANNLAEHLYSLRQTNES